MKLFLALPSPQRDQNWDLPVQSATGTQNVAFGPSHPLPPSQSGKHSRLVRIESGARCNAGFVPSRSRLWVKSGLRRSTLERPLPPLAVIAAVRVSGRYGMWADQTSLTPP